MAKADPAYLAPRRLSAKRRPAGSDLAFMRAQHLDPFNVAFGILQVLVPTGASQRNVDYGAALCAALNEWQLDKWTGPEPRLRGSLLVPQEYPEGAVAEIRRHGRNPAFAQISVAQRTLEPLGRRRYWPIYAEAMAHDLPIGIHSGGYNGHPPVAGGGWCSYYADSHDLIPLGTQAILTSLVMEGVFEAFPKLRVTLFEGGIAWIPALTWRLDALWRHLRTEVPHVKRPPSEYIREHVWFSTQPSEEVENPAHLRRVFDWIGWDRLLFSSDYPHWDYDDARYAFKFSMSEEERRKIFWENATKVFAFDR
ncbi:MAG: amidohydrolase family protein [Acetobacteraceae bacterium]